MFRSFIATVKTKTRNLLPVILCMTIFLFTSCSKEVHVNSDLHRRAVDKISLEPYRSVQKRVGPVQDDDLALGISISGGGSRAEYYGMGILMGLEEIVPDSLPETRNFLTDVDYFSTVSGGGFAAGYYLMVRKQLLSQTHQTFREFCLSGNYNTFSPKINYNATIGRLLDLGYYESNDHEVESFPDKIDRQLLQRGKRISRSAEEIDTMRLRDFFSRANDPKAPTLPMFVANGTVYNNSEMIPFMPHILDSLKIVCSLMPYETWKRRPNQSGDKALLDGFYMPMKYPIAASSAFPGLIPNVKFRTIAKRPQGDTTSRWAGFLKFFNLNNNESEVLRVVDGGVVDNLGYVTLLKLLRLDSASKKSALIVDCSGVGIEDLYGPHKLKVFPLIEKSLFFTLSSKYAQFEDDIDARKKQEGIENARHLKIGITDLRDRTRNIAKMIHARDSLKARTLSLEENTSTLKQYAFKLGVDTIYMDVEGLQSADSILAKLRMEAGETKSKGGYGRRWDEFYEIFLTMMKAHEADSLVVLQPVPPEVMSDKRCIGYLDRIASSSFMNFNEADQLLLYELASLIATNVKIRSCAEKSILVLAGRYTVFLREREIRKIFNYK